jgi:hypothetical protein
VRQRAKDHDHRTLDATSRATEARVRAEDAGARQEQRDSEASSKLQTLHYANGSKEIHAGRRPLMVGDVLKRDGETWWVRSVHVDDAGAVVVTLGPEAA